MAHETQSWESLHPGMNGYVRGRGRGCLRGGDPAHVVERVELVADLGARCDGEQLVDGDEIDLDSLISIQGGV